MSGLWRRKSSTGLAEIPGVGEPRGKTPLLIVDDEKPIRRLLARIAERAGFEADTAGDGVEALELLSRKEYVIAIVDLMMPKMSGYELVQKISTMQPRPVVLVATALTNGDIATLDDSMVRRVIRKPFDVNAVAEALIETARSIADARSEPASVDPSVVVIDEPPVEPPAPPQDAVRRDKIE
jgi:DNA-binding response OmpR family regulator